MEQRTKDVIIIPCIIALAGGFLFMLWGAWYTGVKLHSPFSTYWFKTVLAAPVPLWFMLIIALAASLAAWKGYTAYRRAHDRSEQWEEKSKCLEEQLAELKSNEPRLHGVWINTQTLWGMGRKGDEPMMQIVGWIHLSSRNTDENIHLLAAYIKNNRADIFNQVTVRPGITEKAMVALHMVPPLETEVTKAFTCTIVLEDQHNRKYELPEHTFRATGHGAQRPATEMASSTVENSAASQKSIEQGSSGLPLTQPSTMLSASEPSASLTDGEPLLINSPEQFLLRISKHDSGGIRGIQLQIENYRLTSIHQIKVTLSSARSFDSRQGAFREACLTGQTFTRPNIIKPSCSGQPILLVWKAAQWDSLVTGQNNIVNRLTWPDMDKADVERWKLSLRVVAFHWPANAAGQSTPLKELSTEIVVLWKRSQNEFTIEKPLPLQVSPALPAAFPLNGEDGTSRAIVRFIMCGQDQLLACTTTRENLPGIRFLVVRTRPAQQPQSVETPDRAAANAKWNEWYSEWKTAGFGGASGNGLDGAPPF